MTLPIKTKQWIYYTKSKKLKPDEKIKALSKSNKGIELFIETPKKDGFGSDIHKASNKEVLEATKKICETGICDHDLVFEESGWLYNARECFFCGAGLGAI